MEKLNMYFTIPSGIIDQIFQNQDIERFKDIIQLSCTELFDQDNEVLIQRDLDDEVNFIPGNNIYNRQVFYKFRLYCPIEIIQIDTIPDFEIGNLSSLPKEGLLIKEEDIKGGERLINIYKNFPETFTVFKNNQYQSYEMYGTSIPEFKIEYLRAIELWYINMNQPYKLKDITNVILT